MKGVQKLRDEARSNRSARLAMRSCVPGEIAIVERDVEITGDAPGWLCAAAWMKAIHAWNCLRGSQRNLADLARGASQSATTPR